MPPADLPPMLAGYRIIRTLGVGSRATVYLGIPRALPPPPSSDSPPASAPVSVMSSSVPEERHGGSGPPSVAIKVCGGTTRESVGVEIRALESAAHLPASVARHCVRMMDLATGADALPTLVLSRAPRGSIAQLLHDRVSLEAGETVTILAPIARSIHELHAIGVTHGALSATSVHFGAAGEPVLLGFGHATVFPPNSSPAYLERLPAVATDHQRLALLAELVLCRVRDLDGNTAVRRLLDWIAASSPTDLAFAERLEEKLFSLAPAQPVEFARADRPSVPSRVGAPAVVARSPGRPDAPEGRIFARSRDGVPVVARPLSSAGTALSAARGRLVTALRRVRRPVWVMFATVLAALVAAVVLIPSGRQGTDAGGEGAGNAPTTPAAVSSTIPATRAPGRGETPRPAASSTPKPGEADVVRGDDPLAAAQVLLEARERCYRDLSALCFDDVDHSGSSALGDDRAAVRAILSGGEISEDTVSVVGTPKLVERLGDSALVRFAGGPKNAKPASVLMIRTEAGWRLREFVTP